MYFTQRSVYEVQIMELHETWSKLGHRRYSPGWIELKEFLILALGRIKTLGLVSNRSEHSTVLWRSKVGRAIKFLTLDFFIALKSLYVKTILDNVS